MRDTVLKLTENYFLIKTNEENYFYNTLEKSL